MPELPEVETTRRGLQPVLEGRRLDRVVAHRSDLRFPLPKRFAERLTGRTVCSVERRAKYILTELDSSEILLIHLGMSGRMLVTAGGTNQAAPHDHVVFETDAGMRIVYNDMRRFGFMDLFPASERLAHPRLASLGIEPLGDELDGRCLGLLFKGRKTSLKSALLDQRLVAGLGNIYVCEALYMAGLSPEKAAGAVGRAKLDRLAESIRTVLERAIAAGGSSLRDFAQTSGELGYFQHEWMVYGREGEPCRKHPRTPIRRITQAGRSTFFCPRCQS